MSAMSNFLENALVDLILRGQALTLPGTLHVALFTAAPSDAGGGTEVAGGSYARVGITRALASWSGTQGDSTTVASSGTGGVTKNNATITFPAPTADWGTVTHFAIFDAASGGNLIFHGALAAPKLIENGDQAPIVPALALSLTFA